jgi:GTP-binding protein
MTHKNFADPKIVLVGRANVGKSSLFNCLLEKPVALVSPIAGTTRDRIYGEGIWRGTYITFIDTGGPTKTQTNKISQYFLKEIKRQIQIALDEADLIFFIIDLKEGLTAQDFEVAAMLKKIQKPVILVGNKADNPKIREKAEEAEWLKLGFGKPQPVSAANGTGTGDLLDKAFEILKTQKKLKIEEKEEGKLIKVAIIGKPNVGKSSLLNALLGEERVIVSEIPFTTREPHDTLFTYKNQKFLLVDTVGIRKKAKIAPGIEKIGVERTIERLEKSDIALLVTDVSIPLAKQDNFLAGLVLEKEKGIIIIANKWDLIPKKDTATFSQYYRRFFPYLTWAPIIFVSAKTGEKVKKIIDLILQVKEEREKILRPEELSQFLKSLIKEHQFKIKGATSKITSFQQVGINPPKFLLTIISKEILPKAFIKFIEKRLREKFGFIGTPIEVKIKQIKNRLKG